MRRDTTLRSFLGLLLALLIPAGAAFAQTATVRGIVVDQNGDPLPGASVRVEGNEMIGASTNVDGEYEIVSMPLGQSTLLATFVGFNQGTAEVDLVEGEVAVVNFELFTGVELEGISVDALGFATNKDDLATSQTSVAGDAIQRSGETSVLRALAAKAPGINVSATGGDPGSSTRIVIRGQNSIQGDNQPLIVIDGQPVFNSSIGNATDGVQQANRLNDLNPEDILSVEVLRSASAAALWGSRAQAGVIVITTKKGQTGAAGRPAISFSTRLSIDDLNSEPDLQTDYGQGRDGYYQFTPTGGWSWGDRLDLRPGGEDNFITDPEADGYAGFAEGLITGTRYYPIPSGTVGDPHGGKNSTEVFDTYGTLFEDGIYLDNNLTVSGSDDNGRYFLSAGFLDQDGIIVENSNLQRASIRLNAERNLSSRLNVSGQASYVRSTSDRIQQGSNLSGLLLGGLRNSVDFNVDDYVVNYFPEGEDGPIALQRQRAYRNPLGASEGSIYDNPLFTVNRNLNESRVNRFLGQTEARYQALDWVNLSARLGADFYTDRRFVYFPQFSAVNGDGAQTEQNLTQFQLNGDLIARAERDITDDIGASLLLGFNLNHRETDNVGSDLVGFTLPIYDIGDDAPFRSLGNAETADVTGFTGQSVRRTLGYYGEAGFDLYDQLFLNFTGRFDEASTFGPEADDLFFYPSASIAWQFSELLGDNAGPLSFGKLRASYGEVGSEPDPYLAPTYFFPQSAGDGYTDFAVLDASAYGGGFARSFRLGSPVIVPERKTEFEVGTDLRLFGDRVSLGAVYYNNETDNAIFDIDVAPSRGFTTQTANAATISNEGVELSLDVAWPNLGDFGWNTYASWWTNENVVEDLAGVTEFSLGGFTSLTSSLVEGEEFGVLYGNRWRRAGTDGCTLDDEGDCIDSAQRSFEPLTDQEAEDGFSIAPDGRVLDSDGFPVQASQQGIVGNPNPDWRASIGNTLRFKDLSLNALFDFSIGGDVWNGTQGALSFFGRAGYQDWWTTISAEEAENLTDWFGLTVAERCDGDSAPLFGSSDEDGTGSAAGGCAVGDVARNADGTYTFRGYVEDFDGDGGNDPKIINQYYYWDGPGSGFTGPSEPFIEDASFVRLREVTLSYNWRDQIVQRLGISSINIAVTGRNLWLASDYSGVDPETNLTGPLNGQGLDYFNNPATRSYQVSLRFTY
jgi:TonB-linked SusC/RagA family outer membrane protein